MESFWDIEASAAARDANENHFEAYRGVVPWQRPGILAVFGNDGYDDPRVRWYVARFRAEIERTGCPVLGFGTDCDGYSWAMLVKSDDAEGVEDALWSYVREEERRPANRVGATNSIAGDW
jgi:hypothetical protein